MFSSSQKESHILHLRDTLDKKKHYVTLDSKGSRKMGYKREQYFQVTDFSFCTIYLLSVEIRKLSYIVNLHVCVCV